MHERERRVLPFSRAAATQDVTKEDVKALMPLVHASACRFNGVHAASGCACICAESNGSKVSK